MIKTYLIGLIIFSAIKIGGIIITKRNIKTFKVKIFPAILNCIFWPLSCCYIIYLAIKEIRQQRFIKKIRASKEKKIMTDDELNNYRLKLLNDVTDIPSFSKQYFLKWFNENKIEFFLCMSKYSFRIFIRQKDFEIVKDFLMNIVPVTIIYNIDMISDENDLITNINEVSK